MRSFVCSSPSTSIRPNEYRANLAMAAPSLDVRAGPSKLVQRPSTVSGLKFDRPDRTRQHRALEAQLGGVENRVLHAIVRGQPDHDQPPDRRLTQQVLQWRAGSSARRRIADREGGVSILPAGSLLDDLRVWRHLEVRVEFRP